jgi:hypothetical protein
MTRIVVLDNEAVQALGDVTHPKHRRVLSHVQVVAQRKRRAIDITVVVPTAVRVEAGWDRTAARWALANRLPIRDEPLGTAQANSAAAIRIRSGVSVPDSHMGAVIRSAAPGQVTVLTSDRKDARTVAGTKGVTIVVI